MIYAVLRGMYNRLNAASELQRIRHEIRTNNSTALTNRIRSGQLVQARNARRYPNGQRDRCYVCGDEVTPCYRSTDGAHYFRHLNNPDCIGDPANPAGAKQY